MWAKMVCIEGRLGQEVSGMKQTGQPRILHVTDGDRKFIPALMDFFGRHFEAGSQEFIVMGRDKGRKLEGCQFIHVKRPIALASFWLMARKFDKIIFHGLLDFHLVSALRMLPMNFANCYWVVWGGDLDCYNVQADSPRTIFRNQVRKSLVKRLGHIIAGVDDDVERARDWYGFQGKFHKSIAYLSNTVSPDLEAHPPRKDTSDGWNVIVGHSGYSINFHSEIFNRLETQIEGRLGKVYCPLSYGNQGYIDQVVEEGKQRFGENFQPLLDFLPLEEYLAILGKADAVIYAHESQQALGNTIALLGMGKKIYLRKDTGQWDMFTGLGIQLYDCTFLSPEPISPEAQAENIRITKEYFSEKNLAQQYRDIFSS